MSEFTEENRRTVSIHKEVGNALRKWALAVIAVGVFQFTAIVWGAATLHTTVNSKILPEMAMHDRLIKSSIVENSELKNRTLVQAQRITGLESSLSRLESSMEIITESINAMSVDIAVLRRERRAK